MYNQQFSTSDETWTTEEDRITNSCRREVGSTVTSVYINKQAQVIDIAWQSVLYKPYST